VNAPFVPGRSSLSLDAMTNPLLRRSRGGNNHRPDCACRLCAFEPDPVLRFWSYVQKGDGCWEWVGPKNRYGYGVMRVERRRVAASRYSYQLAYGEIADRRLFVCHHCDNPACVRPGHLFLGTNLDNRRDAQVKGRLARSECPSGHAYIPENTYVSPRGQRMCRACQTRREKARNRARRLAS
jgi:hypothetical protein